jgi:hypothetical protein
VVISLQEDAEASALLRNIAAEEEPEWKALKQEQLVSTLLGLVRESQRALAADLDLERSTLLARIEMLGRRLESSASDRLRQEEEHQALKAQLDLIERKAAEGIASLQAELRTEREKPILARLLERIGLKR